MVSNPNTPWRNPGKIKYSERQEEYLRTINLLASHRSKLSKREKIFLDNLLKEVDYALEQGHILTSGIKFFRTRYDRVLSLLKKHEDVNWR